MVSRLLRMLLTDRVPPDDRLNGGHHGDSSASRAYSPLTRLRLTRKLAERIDGVDLSDRRVGEVIDVSPGEARLLLAEQWAELAGPQPSESAEASAAPAGHEVIGDIPVTIRVPLTEPEST